MNAQKDFDAIENFFIKYGNIREITREDDEKTNVYALFDEDKNLIYVGQAQNVESRFKEHRKKMPSACLCRYVPIKKEDINDVEFYLLSSLLPINNKSFPPKKSFFTIDEYQSFDKRFYSHRIQVLKILKERSIDPINGYYHVSDLNFASSKLDEVKDE